jgi:hypothetical protein
MNLIYPSDKYFCRFGINGMLKNTSFTLGIFTRKLWNGFHYSVDCDEDDDENWHTLNFGIGYLTWVNHDKDKQ